MLYYDCLYLKILVVSIFFDLTVYCKNLDDYYFIIFIIILYIFYY